MPILAAPRAASDTPRTAAADRRTERLTYAVTALTSVLAASWILQIWRADLSVPFFYGSNDATAVAAHFKTVLETGWYEYQPMLSAPVGQHYHDFPTADNLHFMAAYVLGWFTDDFAVAMNWYYFLGFPLAGLTAVYFLRTVGVSRLLTVPLATLFAVAPYHLLRNEGHLWLASYYPLPLALVVVWRLIRAEPVWGVRQVNPERLSRLAERWRPPIARILGVISGRGAGTAASLAVLSTASTYYAVFVLLLIAAAGTLAVVRTGDRRRFGGAILAGVVVVGSVLANMLPDLLYSWAAGLNSAALDRNVGASEVYALKMTSLLVPAPGHPIKSLSDFRYGYDALYPVPSESPALGAVAAAGFLILLLMAIEMVANRARHRIEVESVLERRERLRQLAALVLVALLCSTVGGLSTLVSFLTPALRGWNRMTIVIAIFCLAAVGLILDAALNRRWRARTTRTGSSNRAAVAVAAVLLVVGVADQSLTTAVPPYRESADLYKSDRTFVHTLESKLAPGSMVFQLPFVAFPESPALNGVADADQLKLYLSSTTLRWSAGGIRGRPQADWPEVVTSLGTESMVRSLATIGFAGVTVDRKRLGNDAENVENELISFTGPAELTSPNGRYAYFSLAGPTAQLRAQVPAETLAANAALLTNPVMTYPGRDFYWTERVSRGVTYRVWKTGQSSTAIDVVNNRGTDVRVTLKVQLGTNTGAPDIRVIAGASNFVVDLPRQRTGGSTTDGVNPADQPFTELNQEITVPAGTSVIRLEPGPKTLAAGDVDGVEYLFHHLLLLDPVVAP